MLLCLIQFKLELVDIAFYVFFVTIKSMFTKSAHVKKALGNVYHLNCFLHSLQSISSCLVLAVNEEYISLDDTINLKSGDHIAVIPPLSGG